MVFSACPDICACPLCQVADASTAPFTSEVSSADSIYPRRACPDNCECPLCQAADAWTAPVTSEASLTDSIYPHRACPDNCACPLCQAADAWTAPVTSGASLADSIYPHRACPDNCACPLCQAADASTAPFTSEASSADSIYPHRAAQIIVHALCARLQMPARLQSRVRQAWLILFTLIGLAQIIANALCARLQMPRRLQSRGRQAWLILFTLIEEGGGTGKGEGWGGSKNPGSIAFNTHSCAPKVALKIPGILNLKCISPKPKLCCAAIVLILVGCVARMHHFRGAGSGGHGQ